MLRVTPSSVITIGKWRNHLWASAHVSLRTVTFSLHLYNDIDFYSELVRLKSRQGTKFPELFRDIPPFCRANSTIISQLCQDIFLWNPIKYIIHHSEQEEDNGRSLEYTTDHHLYIYVGWMTIHRLWFIASPIILTVVLYECAWAS